MSINNSQAVCVIVGASHAGAQCAESVRKSGWQGQIILYGDEDYLPYHRPPLSKTYLSEEKEVDEILIKPRSVYEKNEVDVRTGMRVNSLDCEAKKLQLANGDIQAFDKCVLAVGARARSVPLPGADADNVFYIRTAADIEHLRPSLAPGKRAVIIGGGYIGLETAASLRALNLEVTILEMMPRILQRITAQAVSAFYARVHTEEGVKIKTDVAIEEIVHGDGESLVVCDGGENHAADLVIIGAGVLPNIELAKNAGIAVQEDGAGIIVDEFCRTSHPDIFAIGDCTWHNNPIYERWLRLESVPNATDQARVAGFSVCGVLEKPYASLPWFWSDQYNMKLQIAGLSQGFDDVVIRGNIKEGRQFAAFYFTGERLLAVDAVGMPAAFMVGKRLITAGSRIDKERLTDVDVELKNLL